MWEQLDKMPPLAVITFGAVAAFLWFVRANGITSGFRAAAGNNQPAIPAITTMQIDPEGIKAFSSALDGLTHGLKEHSAAMKEQALVLKEAATAGHDLARNVGFLKEETNRIREELRIHRELDRRKD